MVNSNNKGTEATEAQLQNRFQHNNNYTDSPQVLIHNGGGLRLQIRNGINVHLQLQYPLQLSLQLRNLIQLRNSLNLDRRLRSANT